MVWHYSTYIDRITSGATLLLQLRKQRKYRNNHSILHIARTDIAGPQSELIEWLVGRAQTPLGIDQMACRLVSPSENFGPQNVAHSMHSIRFELLAALGSGRSAPRSSSVSTLRSCSSSNESLS